MIYHYVILYIIAYTASYNTLLYNYSIILQYIIWLYNRYYLIIINHYDRLYYIDALN